MPTSGRCKELAWQLVKRRMVRHTVPGNVPILVLDGGVGVVHVAGGKCAVVQQQQLLAALAEYRWRVPTQLQAADNIL